jgi:aldehyde dehydrogenase (NAD+)
VLVDRRVERPFLDHLGRAIRDFYGPDPSRSPDYARIVNERHFDRLASLLDACPSSTVVHGGERVRAQRYVAPTVLSDVSWKHPIMGEEIFGPILPVLGVAGVEEAIATVHAHDRPLALYVFSEQQAVIDRVVAQTSSGGVCANATLVHLAVPGLPFGGVGESGMGAYHGQTGFETFSHRKAVLQRSTRLDPPAMYPPYTRVKQWIMRRAF